MSRIVFMMLLLKPLLVSGQISSIWKDSTVVPFGLFVANNRGGENVDRLHYAHRDAEKMKEVLVDLGDLMPERTQVVIGGDSDEVLEAMRAMENQLKEAQKKGISTMLIFYYSGHAKDGRLLLGDSRLPLSRVKKWFRNLSADIRIAFIDTCQAGEMTRMKGGRLAPSMVEMEQTKGEIIVTSSSASEASQESDEIGGSFFTHFLTSGLRGAADLSADGKISIREVYEYTYHQTVNRTAHSRGGTQHPTYGYQLTGHGDIVLTRTRSLSCGIDFMPDLKGDYIIYDLKKLAIVAEVNKSENRSISIAVMPGVFVVKKRRAEDLLMGEFVLEDGQRLVVSDEQLVQVSYDDDVTKGLVSVKRKTRYLTYSLRLGGQSFFDRPSREDLFYSTFQIGAQIEFFGIVNEWISLGLDVLVGSGKDNTRIELGESESIEVGADFFRIEVGVGMNFNLYRDWYRLYAGPRLGFLIASRKLGKPLENWPTQTFSTLSPGVAAGVSVPIGSFEVFLEGRAHYLYYNIESNASLGYGGAYLGVAYRN